MVTRKMPKLDKSYNLVWEACCEASLPIFFICFFLFIELDSFVP